MKTRFTSLDLAAELSVLQKDVVGMRVNQVYDIDHKSYILKLQERILLLHIPYSFKQWYQQLTKEAENLFSITILPFITSSIPTVIRLIRLTVWIVSTQPAKWARRGRPTVGLDQTWASESEPN